MVWHHSINNSYITLMFSLSPFTAFLYGTSKVLSYLTYSRNLEKYNKKLPYRLLVFFTLLLLRKLRLLLAWYPFIYIWISLVAIIRWEQPLYLLIILLSYYSNTIMLQIWIHIIFCWIRLSSSKDSRSRAPL